MGIMSKLDHLSLLKFLSRPRFAHEVAEHYRISKELANFHLREAFRSGRVLISEKPVSQTLKDSDGKPRRFKGFLYVSRKSPMLTDSWAKFGVTGMKDVIARSKGNAVTIRFLSKTWGSLGKGTLDDKLFGFTSEENAGLLGDRRHFKMEGRLTSEFDVSSTKSKLAKRRTVDQLLKRGPQSTEEGVKSLSYVEKINLFQALSKNTSTFLDLHGRFGVSRQTLRSLVKNGLVKEMWEPKGIGVKYKLTERGEIHLKQLEAAARCEPRVRKSASFKLKHRTWV